MRPQQVPTIMPFDSMFSGGAASSDSPQAAEQHGGWWLGAKLGIAMMIADVAGKALGYDDPTWAVLSAAFLSTQQPAGSLKSAGVRLLAALVGALLGVAGAASAQWFDGLPMLHFLLVGLVVGLLASRSSTFLFTAVVATVITFTGGAGEQTILEATRETLALVLLGAAIAPPIVWAMERLRGLLG